MDKSPKTAAKKQSFSYRIRALDIAVILLCLTSAAVSLNFFRLDLFQTIASQNSEPVGIVTVKYNNVQRRFLDRVLWGRLFTDSPVYVGDLIRVAEVSSATLHIADNDIDLNENTLIRILRSSDGESVMLNLDSGSLSVASGDSGGITLSLMGNFVTTSSKTVLSAAAGDNGITVQVHEGSASVIKEDEQEVFLDSGILFSQDSDGAEISEPAVVVMQPRPNARFLKNSEDLLNINFAWNTVNVEAGRFLFLEISADNDFLQAAQIIWGHSTASANLEAGQWYWRLLLDDTVMGTGQFSVVNAHRTVTVSPANGSLLNYQDTPPVLCFEWQEAEEAASYLIEIGKTPELNPPDIVRRTETASIVDSNMEDGTWYWRVLPVFSSVYHGSAAYSPVASFHIEKSSQPEVHISTEPNIVLLPLPAPPPSRQRLVINEIGTLYGQ